MRASTIVLAMLLITAGAVACGPAATSSYPSYEDIIARYAPPGEYPSARFAGGPSGASCDCPRVWYHDHWVYYYHGHWIYWRHGHWYSYPYLYVYYVGGVPYVYHASTRNITEGPPPGAARPDDRRVVPDRGRSGRARTHRARPTRVGPSPKRGPEKKALRPAERKKSK